MISFVDLYQSFVNCLLFVLSFLSLLLLSLSLSEFDDDLHDTTARISSFLTKFVLLSFLFFPLDFLLCSKLKIITTVFGASVLYGNLGKGCR